MADPSVDAAHVVRADTVTELLERSQSVIVDEHGAERSVADVLAAGRRLAFDLAAAGVQRGDRIAVQMKNEPLYLDLLAAAAVGGFVMTAVNLRFAGPLAESIIERSGAKLTIRGAANLPPATDAGDAIGAIATTDVTNLSSADDRYAIFTTSGTTSAPKLVVHRQRSIAAHGGDIAAAFGYGPESVVFIAMPLCGVFGFSVLWGALAGHARIVLPSSFDAEQTGRLVQEHGVTSLHGTDDMFHRLLATDWDLSSIGPSGYARFNTALDGIVERCDARGVPLFGLYGMSEVQALYAYRAVSRTDQPIEERWRAAGELVSPLAERRVVDGELQLQGPSLFEGYLADGGDEIDTQLTEAAFDGPWFKTGDLAEEDGPRSFEYIARMGDVMRLGGFLVAPTEVEGAIIELPGIDQAQVVAVDRPSGARPVAFVIVADGASLDEQAVIDHCQNTLARFKSPVRVVEVDEFPVTDGPNGVKIQRAKLRDLGAELLSSGD